MSAFLSAASPEPKREPATQFTLNKYQRDDEPGEQLTVTKKAEEIKRRLANVPNYNKGAKLLV